MKGLIKIIVKQTIQKDYNNIVSQLDAMLNSNQISSKAYTILSEYLKEKNKHTNRFVDTNVDRFISSQEKND